MTGSGISVATPRHWQADQKKFLPKCKILLETRHPFTAASIILFIFLIESGSLIYQLDVDTNINSAQLAILIPLVVVGRETSAGNE